MLLVALHVPGTHNGHMNKPIRLPTNPLVSGALGCAVSEQMNRSRLAVCTLAGAARRHRAAYVGEHSDSPELIAVGFSAKLPRRDPFDLELTQRRRELTPRRDAVLLDAQGFGQLHLRAEVGDGI